MPDANSVYDSGGNKVASFVGGVWRFLIYDAFGNLAAEYGGPEQTDEGGVKFIHQDIQGSTRCVTNINGNVIARMDYQAFGGQIASNIGQRSAAGFNSEDSIRLRYGLTERDEATGLDDTWWRKHENQAGRWTSPDPYNGSMSLGSSQSFNRYSYVENQPSNFVDPSGLMVGYVEFYAGLTCVLDPRDGMWHCMEQIHRYWFEFGGGGGGGGISGGNDHIPQEPFEIGSLTSGLTKESKFCAGLRAQLNQYAAFFEELWQGSASGTPNAKEQGGLIGTDVSGAVTAGVGEPPKTRRYAGKTESRSMGPDFSNWVLAQLGGQGREQIARSYTVHTHPMSLSTVPSGQKDEKTGKNRGDKPASADFGRDGIIVTDTKLGVYNEAGRYCEFGRNSDGLYAL